MPFNRINLPQTPVGLRRGVSTCSLDLLLRAHLHDRIIEAPSDQTLRIEDSVGRIAGDLKLRRSMPSRARCSA